MDLKIVLASHGKFASGILSSLRILYGMDDRITALDCYTNKEFDLEKSVKKIIDDNTNNKLLVVTDIFGGSVNNEFLKYIHNPNYYLVSGMNLPFLLELITKINGVNNVDKLISSALVDSKKSIQFCNKSFKNVNSEEDF
jgi:Phosphotransferase system, mannose/fructose-specific component IIA